MGLRKIEQESEEKSVESSNENKVVKISGSSKNLANAKGRVVLIDDDPDVLSFLESFLSHEGYSITSFSLASDALKAFETGGQFHGANTESEGSHDVDLVISDVKMPELDGLEFVKSFKELRAEIPVLLLTAYGSIETAIEAIRRGAYDYIVKPFKFEEMSVTIERAIQLRKLKVENQQLRKEIEGYRVDETMIGRSPPMIKLNELVKRISNCSANVLIEGESGTGKDVLARAIHKSGPRVKKPYIAINCAAIPEALLESELFGHAKGSFTGAIQRRRGIFEEADGGTVFLDEIGDMSLALQVKLLRVIQEKAVKPVGDNKYKDVDIRIIAATNQNLKAAIKDGRFREDLYYRLSVIPISLPPLRERREDIPLLADHFLRKFTKANGMNISGFTRPAIEKLVNMYWEGNVRELENVVERATVLCSNDYIDESDIYIPSHDSAKKTETGKAPGFETEGQIVTLRDMEKNYIEFVLRKTSGRKDKAAQLLGIDRKTLYRKERRYGLLNLDIPGANGSATVAQADGNWNGFC